MMSSNATSEQPRQMEGVNSAGVYLDPEFMEDDANGFEMEVGNPPQAGSRGGGAPQPQPSGEPQVPDLMRMTQQQLMAQLQGGPVGGGAPLFPEGRQGDPPPNITVNHTYNIHYQSDRPSPESDRDVEAYGQELTNLLNNRALRKSDNNTLVPTDVFTAPNVVVTPPLQEVEFFYGKTGIDVKTEYIPDPHYRKQNVRKFNGKEITIQELHANMGPNDNRECRHVAIIGNPGCGKTVLLKRYARMVLNREVPLLDEVEVVHYVDMNEIDENQNQTTADMLVDRMVNASSRNTYKHGFEWMRRNPEKILFLFDQADKIVYNFHYRTHRVSLETETQLRVVLQNIITDHLFQGCRTVIAARDNAWKEIKGDSRPQKFVAMGGLSDNDKLELTRAVCPGLQGKEFSTYLERRFPGALSLSSDVMHLYFSLASLQFGCPDRSAITTDGLLVIASFGNYLRSYNSSRYIVEKIPKMKIVGYDLVNRGVLSWDMTKFRSYNALEVKDLYDLAICTPTHNHCICFRLLECDYTYFFPHQILQELLAACYIAEMKTSDFKAVMTEKIHTPKWAIVRRLLCTILLAEKMKDMLLYWYESPENGNENKKELKSSLVNTAKEMDKMSAPDRFEFLATLHECCDAGKPIIQSHVHEISLPDVILEPCDLYIISRISHCIHEQLKCVNLCLGKEISVEEFTELIETAVLKSLNIEIDAARLHITDEHVDAVKMAAASRQESMRRLRKREVQQQQCHIHLFVNFNTNGTIFHKLNKIKNEMTSVKVERKSVPQEEANGEACPT